VNEENVFAIRDRASELFRLHNTSVPQPQFGEEPVRYRQRVLSCAQALLPRAHVWAGVNIGRQPSSALDSIERAILHDRVKAFRAPTGPLREVTEACPRTGRVVTRFYGDPENAWSAFKCAARRVSGFTNEGRGASSPKALADQAAAAAETDAAFAALAEKRAGR
jgi:hypothetical protein